MATHIPGIYEENLRNSIKSCKLLVVGAGGIGCELLKNLVLTGFEEIEVIDLDTIDVSNLNRQFLFHKQHVGRSKSEVARESALRFNPKAKITAYHDTITKSTYGVPFYQKFTVVMNALDNRAARNHVNRMCLAAGVPLVESGTAGYLGQVTVIQKGLTECYECQPKPTQKTFPGCTIRNTPSEPIHCIVWAKHLFNQLFGEADPDEDVSPDSADPEQVGEAGQSALDDAANDTGNVERVSTRGWATSHDYNSKKLFSKLFSDDIQYLLSMDKLWEKRRRPTPLDWDKIQDKDVIEDGEGLIQDQRPWTITECRDIFNTSVGNLYERLQKILDDDTLVWDKDDKDSMDFVTACSNIRAHIFGIQQKTRFDVKSMAGNIVPAIATTNAIIAGLIVLEAMKILQGKIEECKTVYLNRKPNPRKRLLVPCVLDKPNPKCYVCSEKPELCVRLNIEKTTVRTLEDKILKSALNMVAPDVEISDGKGTILISSEEGETEANSDKMLKEFNVVDGTRLNCDDFLQNYTLMVNLIHSDKLEDGVEFEVIGNPDELKKAQEEQAKMDTDAGDSSNGPAGAGASSAVPSDDENDLVCLDDEQDAAKKRKIEEDEERKPAKKLRSATPDDDDIIIL
ncbi:SUMO-activating enzyme subunit 2-like isoform X1 [Homarus americanus]|uniref:SUMO-activating enzyme subunit 2-like isoform X1 n=1 Tax=Homarus americanus TaxID=6706 RepID=UPI001C450B89|nr:SUMO-activating enzyme subunit 2-like isoform X1 [Homarus americanus]